MWSLQRLYYFNNSLISCVFLQDVSAASRRNSAAGNHLHPEHGGNQDAAGQPAAHEHELHHQRLQNGLCQQGLGPLYRVYFAFSFVDLTFDCSILLFSLPQYGNFHLCCKITNRSQNVAGMGQHQSRGKTFTLLLYVFSIAACDINVNVHDIYLLIAIYFAIYVIEPWELTLLCENPAFYLNFLKQPNQMISIDYCAFCYVFKNEINKWVWS